MCSVQCAGFKVEGWGFGKYGLGGYWLLATGYALMRLREQLLAIVRSRWLVQRRGLAAESKVQTP